MSKDQSGGPCVDKCEQMDSFNKLGLKRLSEKDYTVFEGLRKETRLTVTESHWNIQNLGTTCYELCFKKICQAAVAMGSGEVTDDGIPVFHMRYITCLNKSFAVQRVKVDQIQNVCHKQSQQDLQVDGLIDVQENTIFHDSQSRFEQLGWHLYHIRYGENV